MVYKRKLTKQFLETEYIYKQKTKAAIARKTGYTFKTIEKYLKKYGIPIDSLRRHKSRRKIMKLINKEYIEESYERYDLEVADTHNFIANGIVVHNCNGRWVFHNGEYYCGSRTEWKREYPTEVNPDETEAKMRTKNQENIEQGRLALSADELEIRIAQMRDRLSTEPERNLWWRALRATPALEEWLKAHPDVIVYGEVYGAVQNLRYGCTGNEVRIAVFDLLNEAKWVDVHAARLAAPELPWVPVLAHSMPYNFAEVAKLAEGQSLVSGANHIREGVVVKPLHERTHDSVGRAQLKVINPKYLEKDV